MTTPADGSSIGWWSILAGLFGGSGLSALAAIWWSGRQRGGDEATAKALRADFDEHAAGDKAMFAHLEARIDAGARESVKRHEDNLLRFGALSAQLAALPTDERMDRRFAELGALIRDRSQH